MTDFHILAGLLSLLSGAIAMFARKGSILHRRSGDVFVLAMLGMTTSAVILATWWKPNPGNITAGLLAFYLVATSALTVRAPLRHARGVALGLCCVGLAVGSAGTTLGFAALQRPNGAIDGIPAAPLFLFGFVGLLGAALDLRQLVAGFVEGRHRIARHLWRMMFAMWLATTSAFLGQAKFIPEPLRLFPLLALPSLLVVILLFYWLLRTLRGPKRIARLRDSNRATLLADAAD